MTTWCERERRIVLHRRPGRLIMTRWVASPSRKQQMVAPVLCEVVQSSQCASMSSAPTSLRLRLRLRLRPASVSLRFPAPISN